MKIGAHQCSWSLKQAVESDLFQRYSTAGGVQAEDFIHLRADMTDVHLTPAYMNRLFLPMVVCLLSPSQPLVSLSLSFPPPLLLPRARRGVRCAYFEHG